MKYYVLIIFSVLFLNCEKEVQIDLPEHKSVPVLNCLFSQDSIFKIHLSKTVSIFDNFSPEINDATVQLFEDDVFMDELFFDGEIYKSTILPIENKKYRIEVSTPEFPNISASDYIPSKPILISASFEDYVYTDEEGGDISQVTIKFQDNTQKRNFYEVIVVVETGNEYQPYYIPYFDLLNNDPVLLNEEILAYYPEYLVFSDELFGEERYTLKVNYRTPQYANGEVPKLTVYVRHITEDYYNYKKRLIIHLYNQTSDIWDGSGEPIPMYTNIDGGYGIFAGYSQAERILQNN